MKIQIRKSVFETNSSSMHVIAVSKNHIADKYTIEHQSFIPDEFGWTCGEKTDTDSLASFALELFRNLPIPEEFHKEVENYDLREYMYSESIIRSLYANNGYDDSNLNFDYVDFDGEPVFGYIDHGNEELNLAEYLLQGDNFFKFIFGESIIRIYSDSYYTSIFTDDIDKSKFDVFTN